MCERERKRCKVDGWVVLSLTKVHSKSFKAFHQSCTHGEDWSMAENIVPSREGRAVVGYRTWHRACVRGLIERQRPMRKGKKIKRGRKGKHLGLLDILSAPQYPTQAWKNPMNGIHNSNKMSMSRVERILDSEWGWEIKCWMDKSLGTIPSSPCVREPNVQRQYEFLFVLENAPQMFDARRRVGGGMGVEGDKTNSN